MRRRTGSAVGMLGGGGPAETPLHHVGCLIASSTSTLPAGDDMDYDSDNFGAAALATAPLHNSPCTWSWVMMGTVVGTSAPNLVPGVASTLAIGSLESGKPKT